MLDALCGAFYGKTAALIRKVAGQWGENVSVYLLGSALVELARLGFFSGDEVRALRAEIQRD